MFQAIVILTLVILVTTLSSQSVSAGVILFEDDCESPMTDYQNYQGFQAGGAPTTHISSSQISGRCSLRVETNSTCTAGCWANIILQEPITIPPKEGVTFNFTVNLDSTSSSPRFAFVFFNNSRPRETILANNSGSFATSLRGDVNINSSFIILQNGNLGVLRSARAGGQVDIDSEATDLNIHNWQMWFNFSHITWRLDGVVLFNGTNPECIGKNCSPGFFGIENIRDGDTLAAQWFDNLLIFEGQENPTPPTPPLGNQNYSINMSDLNQPLERVNNYVVNISNGTASFTRTSSFGITQFPFLEGSFIANFTDTSNTFIGRQNVPLVFDSFNNQSTQNMWRVEIGVTARAVITDSILFFNTSVPVSQLFPAQNASGVLGFVYKLTNDPLNIRVNVSGFPQQIVTVQAQTPLSMINVTANFSTGGAIIRGLNALNNVSLTDWNITISSPDFPSFQFNTTVSGGNFTFPYLNGTYVFNASKEGFTPFNITLELVSGDPLVNLTLFPDPSSISVTILKESDDTLLTQLVEIQLQSTGGDQNLSTTTGSLFIGNLTDNTYTLIFSSSGFSTRTYFVTTVRPSHQDLTAKLLNDTLSQDVTFSVKDSADQFIVGATLSFGRRVNATFPVVGLAVTDISGMVVFEVDPTVEYRFTVSAPAFTTRVFDLTPSDTEYTIFLQEEATINFTSIYNQISYAMIPSGSIIANPNTDTAFQFFVSSPTGVIDWFSMNLSSVSFGNFSNLTSSPNGGSISFITNTSVDAGRTINITYIIQPTGLPRITLQRTYFISPIVIPSDNSFLGIAGGAFGDEFSLPMKGLIITVLGSLVAFLFARLGGPIAGGTAGFLFILVFTGLWISFVIAGAILMVGVILLIGLSRSQGGSV